KIQAIVNWWLFIGNEAKFVSCRAVESQRFRPVVGVGSLSQRRMPLCASRKRPSTNPLVTDTFEPVSFGKRTTGGRGSWTKPRTYAGSAIGLLSRNDHVP